MRFATLATSLLAPFLVSAAPTLRKRFSAHDIAVLQFAHVLEQLETEFYKEALLKFTKPEDFTAAGISVPNVAIQNFNAIHTHEQAHTDFLAGALEAAGGKPITGCKFVFDSVLTDVATMATVARVVEAVGVGAYLGGSVLVDDKNVLVAAASILTIEARHQAFLNTINGASGIPQAFDIALTVPQVLALAGGFIQGCDVEGTIGFKANSPLSITNTGTISPGTLLTFNSSALASAGDQELSCQMLIGGNATASSFPLKDCIVPSGINGPVAVFITTDAQPLAADVVVQNNSTTLAGPAIAFIDSPDALGSLVRNTTNPVQSSNQITPDQASAALGNATAITTGTSTGTDSSSPPPATDASSAPTGTDSSSQPTGTDSSSQPTSTPAQDNSPSSSNAPGAAVQVIGVTSIPASA